MASVQHEGIIKISPQVSTSYTQISRNQEFVALPATSNEIGVWKTEQVDARPVHLRGHSSQITALCFGHMKNPTYLCSASEDSIYLWATEQSMLDYKTGKFTEGLQLAKDLGQCNHLCFSADDFFISACIDKEVWIINTETCELVTTLTGHSATVTGSIFCPHNVSTFVTISEDRTFKIWEIKKGMLLYQSPIISSSPFWSIAMHPEHMHFSVGSGDGKIRVYDLISHRCLHEVEVTSAVSRMDSSRASTAMSSDSDRTISSVPSWRQKANKKFVISHEEESDGDDDAEFNATVLSLAYWKENLDSNKAIDETLDPLVDYDGTVREVLKDPPFLIAGCTAIIVMFDANTMDAIFQLDLTESMMCYKTLDPIEYCVSSAGCFSFSTSEDTLRIHCLVGSMFESNIHVLTIQPDRTMHASSDSSETSDAWSESQDSTMEPNVALSIELSVLSTAPVMEGSPLSAVFESKKQNSSKGRNSSRASNKMNQPLTFKTKVKSSGYSESSRQDLFKPKTNVKNQGSSSARRGSNTVKENANLVSGCLSGSYPIKSEPPVQLKEKIKLPPKPTNINSLKFSADGKEMACALGDKNSYILKIPYNKKVTTFVGHNCPLNYADISHDRSWLLTASDDKSAKLWTQNQSAPLLNFSNIKHNFNAEKVSQTSEKENPCFPKEITKAVFYYVDKFVILSCLNTLYMFKYHIGEAKNDIKRSSQAELGLCSRALENKTGHITCWASQDEDDAESTGQRRGWKNREHTRQIPIGLTNKRNTDLDTAKEELFSHICFSLDGCVGQELPFLRLDFNPLLYQTMNRYKLVRKFALNDVQHVTTFSCINGFYSYIVLAACSDKSVAVFDMNVGKVVRRMKDVHTRNVHSICQNQGSPYVTHPSEAYDLFLTSAATDGIKLWDLRADRCVRKFDGHVNRSQTIGIACSPCSRFIATGSEDRSAYIFDIRNSAYLHRLSGQSDVISCVSFCPQTPMLATGSLDGELRFHTDIL